FAPQSFMDVLRTNASVNNIPIIGSPDNVAYPAVQLNIAPAVERSNCRGVGLRGMGSFGEGHRDTHDSAGGLTTMISNSRLPSTYEAGRFHLLGLGVFFLLTCLTVMTFCGLFRHGGSPPISEDSTVVNDAYRVMVVCYPPHAMLSGAGMTVLPLASASASSLFKLGPEITTPRLFDGVVRASQEASWAREGQSIMQRDRHVEFFVKNLHRLCFYLYNQLPSDYHVSIDPKLFFQAFSALDTENNKLVIEPWAEELDGESIEDYQNDWIDVMEDRSNVVPYMAKYANKWGELRNAIKGDALGLNLKHMRTASESLITYPQNIY
ncbi:hypothetical protein BDN72DRAFT_782410, partial [Pluteus cervinus]